MGSRRLPRAKAVRALAAAFALVLAACSGGEATTPATPSPGATGTVAAPTGTSTAPLPSPTSTPDPLGPPPAAGDAALDVSTIGAAAVPCAMRRTGAMFVGSTPFEAPRPSEPFESNLIVTPASIVSVLSPPAAAVIIGCIAKLPST